MNDRFWPEADRTRKIRTNVSNKQYFFIKIRLVSLFIILCVPIYSNAKDDIAFDCSAIGLGYKTKDLSGPWEHEIGRFQWKYNASLITPEPMTIKDGKPHGCKPVDIESPKITIEKGKAVNISGNRCGDLSSYFFAVTTINNIRSAYALGTVENIVKDKEVRIIVENTDESKVSAKDGRYKSVYFDCKIR